VSASLLGDYAKHFDAGDIKLTTFETVTLSAVIALSTVAAWTARQLTSSMSLIYGEPSIVRRVPASKFGGARSLAREEEHSFDEVLFRPLSLRESRTANVLHGEQDAYPHHGRHADVDLKRGSNAWRT
jgi:hypothetical protein